MRIEAIIELFEEDLFEISGVGGASARQVTDSDFDEIKQFLQLIYKSFANSKMDITLQEVNASLNLIRNRSAGKYIFGSSSGIQRSDARSPDRGDDEIRSANWAGPRSGSQVSGDRAEKTVAVVQSLEKMNYVTIDERNESITVKDKAGLSRVRDFIQTAIDKMNVATPAAALKNFDSLKSGYQNASQERFAPREQEFEGADVVKKITPNILIFLSQVAKNFKRKQSWDSYLNPENFQSVDSETKGYFQYDPKEAARSLVEMGLAVKGERGYLFNRTKIQSTVKEFSDRLAPMYKGAKVENPRNKTGGATRAEQQARQFINFMRSKFSDKVWSNAQKHVFSKMRDMGGAYESSLEWYLGAKDSVTGEDNPESGISAGLEKVNKTLIGTIIDFVTAKYVAKKMLFEAYLVLGKNPKKPASFVTSRDLSLAATAYQTGMHKRPARV